MVKVHRSRDGTIRYMREDGVYHREDGPAVEHLDGYKVWFRNGVLHREDGPAVERPDGVIFFYYNGREMNFEDSAKYVEWVKLQLIQEVQEESEEGWE